VALVAAVAGPAMLSAQTLTIDSAGEALRIRVSGLSFLSGDPVARLKDGRAVRVELAAMVLHGSDRRAAATTRRIFAVSYDLWEERFAVSTVGARSRSASHRALAAAEAWCIEQLAIPLNALSGVGRDVPFWVRLEYQVLDGDLAAESSNSPYTLQGLIDLLSRRKKNTSTNSGQAVTSPSALEGGPFRMPRGSPSQR
jgi:hypothetical protein